MAIDAGKIIAYLDLDMKGFTRGLQTAQSNMTEFATQSTGTQSVLAGVGARVLGIGAAITGAGAAIYKLGDAVITTGMDFDAQMSQVQALSGATADEMDLLREAAIQMGADSVFGATECAEALGFMAAAGWSAEQMIAGLPGVINLSAASGEDLSSVSEIVTDSLTAFGLSASDAAHFSDVLAAASAASTTDVGLMGNTFQYVAPIAGALGYSVEDCAVAIGVLANNGIKGEQAGTSLRAMLTSIVSPTQNAASVLADLGISATTSTGEMKPLSQLMGELREAFSGMTAEQQAQAAAAIAGQEAMSAMLALVNASDEDFATLTDSIEGSSGAAEDMATTMQDNLKGDLEALNGELETLSTTIYESLDPALRAIVQTCTDFVGAMNGSGDATLSLAETVDIVKNFEMPESMQMEELATAAENADALAESIGTLSEKLNNLTLKAALSVELDEEESTEFQQTVEAMLEDGIALVEAQEHEVAVTLNAFMDPASADYQALSEELFQPFFAVIAEEAGETGKKLRSALVDAMTDGGISAEEAAKIQVLAQQYTDSVAQAMANVELKGELLRIQAENVGGTLEQKDIQNIVETVREQVESAAETAQSAADRTITLAYQAAATLELDPESTKRYIDSIEKELNDQLSSIRLEGLNNVMNTMADTLETPDLSAVFADFETQAVRGFGGLGRAIENCAPELVESAGHIYAAMEPDVEELERLKRRYERAGLEVPQGIIDALNRADLLGQIGAGADGIAQYLSERFGTAIDGTGELTEEQVRQMLGEIANVLYTDLAIPNAAGTMWDDVFASSLAGVKSWQTELEIELRAMGVDAGSLLGMALPEGVAQGLADGTMSVREAAQAIVEAAQASQEDVNQAVSDNKTAGQDTGEALAEGEDAAQGTVETATQGLADTVTGALEPLPGEAEATGGEIVTSTATGMTNAQGTLTGAAQAVSGATVNQMAQAMSASAGNGIGMTFVGGVASGAQGQSGRLSSGLRGIGSTAASAIRGAMSSGVGAGIGQSMVSGIISGAGSMGSALASKMRQLGNQAVSAFKSSIEMHSPPQAFVDIGEAIPAAIGLGTDRNAESATDAIVRMGKGLIAAWPKMESAPETGTNAHQLEDGAERAGAGATFQFHFYGDMNVRNEGDIERVSREIYRQARDEMRGGGVFA